MNEELSTAVGAKQRKWNERYRKSAGEPGPPSVLVRSLVEQSRFPAGGAALDVACGSGRNALYLAGAGFQVTAIDFSDEAIRQCRQAAASRGLDVDWRVEDLSGGLPEGGRFDLILVIRYLDLELLRQAAMRLNPGGYLVVEVHMATADPTVAGPRNPAVRAEPGAVSRACAGLETMRCEEGLVTDGDRREALVRYIGRAPGG